MAACLAIRRSVLQLLGPSRLPRPVPHTVMRRYSSNKGNDHSPYTALSYNYITIYQLLILGFGKFKLDPKDTSTKSSKQVKQDVPPSSSGKGGGAEGKGGRKPNPGPGKGGWEWFRNFAKEAFEPENRLTLLALLGAGVGGYFLLNSDNRREISWQEFRTNFLEQGKVRKREEKYLQHH